MERIVRPFEIKEKDVAEDGTFKGYASVFGNMDSYRDIVEPGAFEKTLKKKRLKDIKLLWQHWSDSPVGIPTLFEEDKKGLYMEGKLAIPGVQKAEEAQALMKLGAVTGLSIGFMTKIEEWDKDKRVRRLKEVDLWEVSIVTFPANPKAKVSSVKDATDPRELERALCDAGVSRTEARYIATRHKFSRRDAGDDEVLAILEALKEFRLN